MRRKDVPDETAEISPVMPAKAQTSAANAAAAMLGSLAADARPKAPSASPAPTGPVGQPVNLAILPQDSSQAVGSTFQVAVTAANAKDLYSVPLQVHFDPHVLVLVDVDAGGMLSKDGQAVALVHRDEGNGNVTISATRPPNTKGVDGQGTVCTLTFKALAAGDATVSLVKIGAKDSLQNNLPTIGTQGVVHVK
jgi:general secretion pathway protein D